ncbi:ssDNA binding protein [Erwinia phage Aioli]|nr:ssDNA binding protein [Erwinia phage Aioli]
MSNTKTYDDTNTGIIGANDYKQKDTHPDQRGRCNVGGLWYWVSGWDKRSNNRTFTSLAFTLMTQDEVDKMMAKRAEKERPQQGAQQQQQAQAPAQSQPQQQAPAQQTPPATQNNEPPMDFDDDIPF